MLGPRPCHTGRVRPALPAVAVAVALLSAPASAAAYDRQIAVGVTAGWGLAPALEMFPNHGPTAGLSASLGFDDTWGVAVYGGWAVHPPIDGGETFHVGLFGAEALYYIDILEVVPFFGVGVDALTQFDGTSWGVDFAAHLRASVDYLLSREVTIGLDIRPYILFTNLDLDPIYLTFQARVSFLFDY